MAKREDRPLTNRERILETLERLGSRACDDCLSRESGVKPRQQVREKSSELQASGDVRRESSVCSLCGKHKLTTALPGHPLAQELPGPVGGSVPGVVEALIRIDKLCRLLWSACADRPGPIAFLIRDLTGAAIPPHTANMMHTIRGLRNAYVHDHLVLGKNELAVLEGAWRIIDEWAAEKHGASWRSLQK